MLMETVITGRHQPCRLHPGAAYVRDLGYVFIDLNGRLYRMDEPEFEAFRAHCSAGLAPEQRLAFGALLVECGSAREAEDSFANQDLLAHES
jgi:hypothetical protein